MQHPTPEHVPRVGRIRSLHPQRQVFIQFPKQSLVDMARGDEFAVLAEEGRVVDGEKHRHRRLINGDGGQGLGRRSVGYRFADLEALDADHGADVARCHSVHLLAPQALEDVDLLDLRPHHAAVAFAEDDVLPLTQFAPVDTPHGDTAYVFGIVERGDQHLRRPLERLRLGDVLDNGVEERVDVVRRLLPVVGHPALLGRAEDGGEVELIFRSVEAEHEVEHHLLHLRRPTVRLVYLVDDHDRFQPQPDGFLEHEARLRHWPLEGVDQQQASVGHVEHTLHLAAEVSVARGVDDVDLVILVIDGDVFGEDRNAALAFQVVVVQKLIRLGLSLAEKFPGQKHLVYQRCFAMIDVCYDCNVPNFLHRTYLSYISLVEKSGAKVSVRLNTGEVKYRAQSIF